MPRPYMTIELWQTLRPEERRTFYRTYSLISEELDLYQTMNINSPTINRSNLQSLSDVLQHFLEEAHFNGNPFDPTQGSFRIAEVSTPEPCLTATGSWISSDYIKVSEKPKKTRCGMCGEIHNVSDIVLIEHRTFCKECAVQLPTCPDCGNKHRSSYIVLDGENKKRICSSCFTSRYIRCHHCDIGIGKNSKLAEPVDEWDTVLCPECREKSALRTCQQCNRPLGERRAQIWHLSNKDLIVCPYCYREFSERDRNVKTHNYRPAPRFHPGGCKDKTPLYLGIELEVECPTTNHRDTWAAHFISTSVLDSDKFFIKHDGSLKNGFEIVSHPAVIDWHKTHLTKITKWCREKSFVSDCPTCGLHVHASRNYLSPTEQVKLGIFVNMQRNHMEKIARRTSERYARFKTLRPGQRKIANQNDRDRYEALNWSNRNTVEFRIFRGTLDDMVLQGTLEFVDAVCRFVKYHNVVQVSKKAKAWKDFLIFARANKYLTMLEYFRSRGL